MERRVQDKNRIFDGVEQLQPIAEVKGSMLAQLALPWCAQQPGVTNPIIGPRTMEQLEDNLGALTVIITDEDRARIDTISPLKPIILPIMLGMVRVKAYVASRS